MSKQPIKNTTNYEKFFSKEISRVIDDTVRELAKGILPSSSITPELFFAGALSSSDCILYKVLNGYLTTIKIQEICDKIFDIASKNTSVSVIKPNRVLDYSQDMRVLFNIANKEREEAGNDLITSDHVLMALLSDDSTGMKELRELFLAENLTINIIRGISARFHNVTNEIAKLPSPNQSSTDFPLYDENYSYVSNSMNMDDSGKAVTIAIYGGIEGLGNKDIAEQLSTLLGGKMGESSFLKDTKEKKNEKRKKNVSYCTNITELAEKGELDPIVGRETEIEKIVKVFNRRKCNNVILVGESGVGKTAIVEGIARKIADGSISDTLKDCQIFRLNPAEMMGGTQFRGVFEERMTSFIREINGTKNAILFIDNIHTILNDRQRSDYDFAGMFGTLFGESKTKVIATITPKGYHNTFENDPELSRKFQKIMIDKPTIEECISILKVNKGFYENFHRVKYTDEAIRDCAVLANRYVTERNLPSSAIDIMDEAGSSKRLNISEPDNIKEWKNTISQYRKERDTLILQDKIDEANDVLAKINDIKIKISEEMEKIRKEEKSYVEVTSSDVHNAISEHTNIPLQKISVSEKKFLSKIDEILKKSIIGQDDAINAVSRAIKRNKVGLGPSNRPILSCMCVGSTGTGKTLLAKKLAEEIFGSEKYLIRFDMSEYSDKTAVNKLIGASAGYVGYSEGGLLTEAVKNKKHAVVLIDEIEKADEEVFNIFLQILDEGSLTDNTGQKVDFKNTLLIMTSNVGAKRAANEKGIGFSVDDNANKRDIIEKELKNKFPPEFINRIDEIVYFNNLTDDNLKEIIRLEISKLVDKLTELGHNLQYNEDTIDYIFSIIEKDKEYGARPILRTVQNEIENRITDLLLEDEREHCNFILKITEDGLNIDIE